MNQPKLREASVSNIGLFRTWKEEEGLDVGWMLNKLQAREQTEPMKAGEAFHKAIELAGDSDHYTLMAMDYRFDILCEVDLQLPALREVPMTRQYGHLLVKGRVDALEGRLVSEIKTTEQFDADRYMGSYQWRFYLDIAGADRFDFHVFQMSQRKEKEYEVYGYHRLTQYRYKDLYRDCLHLSCEYYDFLERFVPVPVAV